MICKITIRGKLTGLNEYTNACRRNPYVGANMKKRAQEFIGWQIPRDCKGLMLSGVTIRFAWFEKDRRRDEDNVKSAKKFLLDALVENRVIAGDGQRHIIQLIDEPLQIDKGNPRVEIEIKTDKECPLNENRAKSNRR